LRPHQLDPDSQDWVRALPGTGTQREAALARLHEMLLPVARAELQRRGGQLRIAVLGSSPPARQSGGIWPAPCGARWMSS
jgi:hypothetical protein